MNVIRLSVPSVLALAVLVFGTGGRAQEKTIGEQGSGASAVAPPSDTEQITRTTGSSFSGLPDEPIVIGERPQYFIDDYLVDNLYGLHPRFTVLRKFHRPIKEKQNPLIVQPGAFFTFPNVRYDETAGLYRMWYTQGVLIHTAEEAEAAKKEGKKLGPAYGFEHVRYAQSKDGIHWTYPSLGLYAFQGSENNNICLAHPDLEKSSGKRITNIRLLNEADMPERDLRGYKYLLTYQLRGSDPAHTYLVGTRDGVSWDVENQVSLGEMGTDGWFGIQYDAQRNVYVAYCRPRDRYQTQGAPSFGKKHVGFNDPGDVVYEGHVRRIGRIESDSLWKRWDYYPQTLFFPDAIDFANGVTSHMSCSIQYHAGIYIGCLVAYVPKTTLWTELVLSRDGETFERVRQPWLSPGAWDQLRPLVQASGVERAQHMARAVDGPWDSHQTWAYLNWVDVGNEWWIYYFGYGFPPNVAAPEGRAQGIGLARIRRGGFISLRTPKVGGVVITRLLKWPGGDLVVNCDVPQGEMRVRVTDRNREEVEGMGYRDCVPFAGNSVAHQVAWKSRSLDQLAGQEIRLEFYFSRTSDLYSFRATGSRTVP